MKRDIGEELLRTWLELAAAIWSRQMVSGMTYNEAVVSNLLLHQQQENPKTPLTATELCEKTNIRKSQMNLLLGSLEKQGYLRRCRSEKDRRRVELYLTETGKTAYLASHQQGRALIDAIMAQLGEENTRALTAQLEQVNGIIQRELHQRQKKGTI